MFLSAFYSGTHPGSFARGALFQLNPRTGDSRISGTAASLCGLDAARSDGDEEQVDIALRRLLTLYSVVYSFGGIPLLYMGDELALPNDAHWAQDPGQADDNRWMHRPRMDWAAARRRHDRGSVEARAFAGIAGLARARAGLLALRSGTDPQLLDTGDHRVLAFARRHPRSGRFVALANFSDGPVLLRRDAALPGLSPDAQLVQCSESTELTAYDVALPSWGHAWVADA